MTDEETKRRAAQHARESLERQRRDREATERAFRDQEVQRIAKENAERYKKEKK